MKHRNLRLAAASALAMGSIVFTGIDTLPDVAVGWVMLGGPFLAALLMWVPRLEAQILTRAILWGYLFWSSFGSCIVSDSNGSATQLLLSVGLGSAGALLLLPRDGLGQTPLSSRFAPVAFRGVLVLMVILALADGMVLGTTMLGYSSEWNPDYGLLAFLGIGSVLMTLAVVGLLRMRGWGFALNLATNVGVATGAWLLDEMPWQLALGFTSTAVLQILIAMPLARRLAKPGAGDPSRLLGKLGPWALGAMVGLLVAGRVARYWA